MARIFLSFDDLGIGIQFVDTLEALGHQVDWSRQPADVPPDDLDGSPDAVILGGVASEVQLGKWTDGWRRLEPPPAVLVLGNGPDIERAAQAHRATYVPSSVDRNELVGLLDRAIELRYAAQLSRRFAIGALAIPDTGNDLDKAVMIVARSRDADVALVREAMRPRMYEYATATELIDDLREQRALQIPEVALVSLLDGTRTVGKAIDSGKLEPPAAARLLWALACAGAIRLTREPPDLSTPDRRAVARARHHLRERARRLQRGKGHYYEVMEVSLDPTPDELQGAARRLAVRFSPRRLAHLDLGDVSSLVQPLWEQIEKAYRMLADPQSRAQYEHWLASKGTDTERLRRDRACDPSGAEADFARGQQALTNGQVHQAVSLFAAAARRCPGHADYEAYLAWARYRVALDRGEDKNEAAMRERHVVEEMMAGRQPRARALLALGLLCAASDDPAAARWNLNEALVVDPDLNQARQILDRIGVG